jgi:hypothetical protein
MGRRKEDLEKVTLNLFPGDFQRLGELFPTIGASKALRSILRKYLQDIEARADINARRVEVDLEKIDV